MNENLNITNDQSKASYQTLPISFKINQNRKQKQAEFYYQIMR